MRTVRIIVGKHSPHFRGNFEMGSICPPEWRRRGHLIYPEVVTIGSVINPWVSRGSSGQRKNKKKIRKK